MKATPATLPRFRARLWPVAVASLIAASALAGHAAPAHAAALHPAQPLDCATNAIQAPSFAVDNDPNSMFWYGLDTSSTDAQTLAGNTMAVQLSDGNCTFTGSIDNNGTFTSDVAAIPAGTYTVSQTSFTYQATVWLTNPRTHSQYQGNVPCTLSSATFTLSGTWGHTSASISGHENCQGQVFIISGSGPSPLNSGSNDSQFSGTGVVTPELASGELLLGGLVPVLGILFYRRRRQRAAATGHDRAEDNVDM